MRRDKKKEKGNKGADQEKVLYRIMSIKINVYIFWEIIIFLKKSICFFFFIKFFFIYQIISLI